jgi:hypothetical protein
MLLPCPPRSDVSCVRSNCAGLSLSALTGNTAIHAPTNPPALTPVETALHKVLHKSVYAVRLADHPTGTEGHECERVPRRGWLCGLFEVAHEQLMTSVQLPWTNWKNSSRSCSIGTKTKIYP